MTRGNRLRIVSIVLILTILFSTVTSFAGSLSSADFAAGLGKAGGGDRTDTWNGITQFLRISLYWAPGGAASDGSENANWDDWSKIKRIGKTFDFIVHNGSQPKYTIEVHSGFTDALWYAKNGNKNAMEYRGDYFGTSDATWKTLLVQDYTYAPGDTVEEAKANEASGNFMEHPTPTSKAGNTGTDVETFFYKQHQLDNDILWMTGASRDPGITKEMLRTGVYKNAYGEEEQGTYMIVVEPGVYAMVGGQYRAYTGRDALNETVEYKERYGNYVDSKGQPYQYLYGKVWLTLARIARGLYLRDNMEYTGINLVYSGNPPSQGTLEERNGVMNYLDEFRSSWGIGVFMYWQEEASLPVIKYYYNLTQSDLDRAARAGTSSGTSGQIAGTVPQFSYTEENGVPMLVESEYGYDENHRYGLRPKQGGAKYTLAEAIKKYPQLVNDKADNAEAIPNTAENYTAEAKETFKEQDYFLVGHYFNQRFPLVSNYGSGLTSVALRIFKVCPCKYQGQAYGAKAPLIFT